jgi:ABC-type microcin C transport system permease subunit YejE
VGMTLSFVFGLGFLLLLVLLPGVLLVGRDSKARRLLASIVIGFAVLVLVLLLVARPCEIIGVCP